MKTKIQSGNQISKSNFKNCFDPFFRQYPNSKIINSLLPHCRDKNLQLTFEQANRLCFIPLKVVAIKEIPMLKPIKMSIIEKIHKQDLGEIKNKTKSEKFNKYLQQNPLKTIDIGLKFEWDDKLGIVSLVMLFHIYVDDVDIR